MSSANSAGEASAVPTRRTLIAQLTAPGGEFEIAQRRIRGVEMRTYASGPQTLREIALGTECFGDLTAVVYRGERWSYADTACVATGLAQCLRHEYGLGKGDRVAVAMRNYPEWLPIWLATQILGLVLVPLNAWWTAAELRYAVADSGARLAIADAERVPLLQLHIDQLGLPALIEVRGGRVAGGTVRPWDDLLDSLDPLALPPAVAVGPDDDATILYTSGTTGRPKGAVGTHRSHCTNIRNSQLNTMVSRIIAAGGELPKPDPAAPQSGALCTMPLFHVGGSTNLGLAAVTGAKLALQYKWDRAEARELIRRERLTSVTGVPTVIRQLVEDAAVYPDDFGSILGISSGGAPVPPDLIGRIGSTFHGAVAPSNGYGLTETTSAVVFNTGADYLDHPDSVGRCQPVSDVRVVDPATDRDVPDGEVGELWFRGPTNARGYWNDPAATAAAFTEGWFRTGDLGRVVDGWVYVVDRMKDVIIRGGENIYCAEVEAVLFEHPAIEDVAIIGIPHASLGEEAVAVVVARSDRRVTAAEIRNHVAERLASFKVPAHVHFRSDPLPRTPSGKVLKRDLRTAVASKIGQLTGEQDDG